MSGSTSAPTVSILWTIRYFSCGRISSRCSERAIAQQVGDLVPVADRVQALHGQIVGVVGAFAGALLAHWISAACRPSRTFCACASSICCGISSQAKRRSRSMGTMRRPMLRPGRKQQRAGIAVVVLCGEMSGDSLVGQIAGGDDVRQRRAALAGSREGSWPGGPR